MPAKQDKVENISLVEYAKRVDARFKKSKPDPGNAPVSFRSDACRDPRLKACQAEVERWTMELPGGDILECKRCGIRKGE